MAKKRRVKKKNVTFIFVLLCLIGGIIYGTYNGLLASNDEDGKEKKKAETKEEEKKITVVDINSKNRNVAVMFNNISEVWGKQAGLQDAYIVYEMLVEGGYTRLMGIYKDAETEELGSVRSSRPYYLDYAFENDAIYVHYGGSKQAMEDIKKLQINNINGMTYAPGFWRNTKLNTSYEHTAFTSMKRIKKGIEHFKYRTTTEMPLLLDYSLDQLDLSTMTGSIPANKVVINFSASHTTTFEYDLVKQVYLRSQNTNKGILYPHKDRLTEEQYSAKNIITYKIQTTPTDAANRQELNNLGSGDAYYITNGYAVPIKWEKRSRSAPTIYRHLDGTRIKVNDGNTYIEIQPTGRALTIQ